MRINNSCANVLMLEHADNGLQLLFIPLPRPGQSSNNRPGPQVRSTSHFLFRSSSVECCCCRCNNDGKKAAATQTQQQQQQQQQHILEAILAMASSSSHTHFLAAAVVMQIWKFPPLCCPVVVVSVSAAVRVVFGHLIVVVSVFGKALLRSSLVHIHCIHPG